MNPDDAVYQDKIKNGGGMDEQKPKLYCHLCGDYYPCKDHPDAKSVSMDDSMRRNQKRKDSYQTAGKEKS
jgi:hypothetical protein